MISLRLRLFLTGPFATPWQADTIAGHLCWAALRLQGPDLVKVLVEEALEGNPLFVLSDGFPGDLLPFPVLPLPKYRPGVPLEVQREDFCQGRRLREMQRHRLVPPDIFWGLLRGEAVTIPSGEKGPMHTRVVLKNQLSRLTGTTGQEGQLFPFHETWVSQEEPVITVYALVRGEDMGLFGELVQEMARMGYGKRKSVGYGAIREVGIEPFEGFPAPEEPEGFLSLSTFVPAPEDPTDGQWEALVKRGKLGEELAAGPNPFKRPLIMLRAGASFQTSPVRAFYGCAVAQVAPGAPDAVQWAFAYPVPIRFPHQGGAS